MDAKEKVKPVSLGKVSALLGKKFMVAKPKRIRRKKK